MVVEQHLTLIEWFLLAAGGVIGILLSMIFQNNKEHQNIHHRIDTVHHSLRDKLDAIWAHLTRNDPGG